MESLPINPTDLAVIIILLISAAIAFLRGMVHEVLAIGAWVGAALITLYFYLPAQEFARKYIEVELAADITAGVVLFLLALVVFSILSRILSRRVQESSLGALDRSLGLLFGLARGFVVAILCWMLVTWLFPEEERPEWLMEARSRPLLEEGAVVLRGLAPEELRLRGESAAEQARENTENAIETGKAVQDLMQPPPRAPEKDGAGEDATGYNDAQRRELQRLIDSQQ
jgi:membrane protein required for colicin V production